MDERQSRVLRLKGMAAAILRQEGLAPPTGWHVDMLPDGTLAVHDPSSPDGNPHGRIRAGIRIDHSGTRTDAALAELMAIQARAALRRMRTYAELQRSDRGLHVSAGWAALAHPIAIALGRGLIGLTGDHLPPARRLPGDVDRQQRGHRPSLFERSITWDLMSVNLGATLRMGDADVNVRLESKPGRTELHVWTTLPETLVAALRGRPLSMLMDVPAVDGRIDAASAGLTIASAVSAVGAATSGTAGGAVTIVVAPTQWLPWGTPPDDVARLIALSPEVS